MRPLPSALLLTATLASACAAPPRPVAPPVVAAARPPDPPGLQLRPHAVNIVDAEAAAETAAFLQNRANGLPRAAAGFYAHFADDYDFLYVCSDGPIEAPSVGVYTLVRRDAIPGTGNTRLQGSGYPAAARRLRGAIALNENDYGNGPTLHETFHHWGVRLTSNLGFGREGARNFGGHWGAVGVFGQEGGFDPTTLRCADPPDARPPGCRAAADGRMHVTVGRFSSYANGGDSIPYAPLELYLMGLIPRAEVGGPLLALDGAEMLSDDPATRRMTWAITGTHPISMDDIVRAHGERPPAPPEERAFRGAFVLFSAQPVSAERLDRLERWAAIFGNEASDPRLLSFERATGGRATFSTRLGAAH
jgi:hypothetical protein